VAAYHNPITSNPHNSTQVEAQSEASENSGSNTPIEVLWPSLFDENGKLIEFDQQSFLNTLNYFGKYWKKNNFDLRFKFILANNSPSLLLPCQKVDIQKSEKILAY